MKIRTEEDAAADYLTFRGKCKELAKERCRQDPTLRLVRGHYFDALWGEDLAHWWCEKPDGTVVDPSCRQFPTNGHGIYTEFDGVVTCDNCGKQLPEGDAVFMGQYPACSNRCAGAIVGVDVV